jgi:hypothetical protein
VNNLAWHVPASYVGCPAGAWVTSLTKGDTTGEAFGGTNLSALDVLGCAAPAPAIAERYGHCYEEPFPAYGADHLNNGF